MENLLIIEALSMFERSENGKRFQETKGGHQMLIRKGQRIPKLQKPSLAFTTENSAERMVKHMICDI